MSRCRQCVQNYRRSRRRRCCFHAVRSFHTKRLRRCGRNYRRSRRCRRYVQCFRMNRRCRQCARSYRTNRSCLCRNHCFQCFRTTATKGVRCGSRRLHLTKTYAVVTRRGAVVAVTAAGTAALDTSQRRPLGRLGSAMTYRGVVVVVARHNDLRDSLRLERVQVGQLSRRIF